MLISPTPLEHVAIFWIQITQLGLFIVGEPNVVRLFPVAILCQAGEEIYDAAGRAQADEPQADAIALVKECLRVGSLEAVTGNDSSDVSKSNLPSGSHSTAVMTTEIH